MMKVIKRGFWVIFSSILLTACSFSFIYNHLDWWSNWYLDDYVTLNQEQQQNFDTAFNELHLWHRQTQLKEYYLQLAEFKDQVNLGITKYEINEQLAKVKMHWVTVREHAKPQLILLAHTLSDNQRRQVIDEIAINNKDRIDEGKQLTEEEFYKAECKQRQQQFKKWVGKLTKGQKAKVCELTQGLRLTFNHRMDYRIKWHSGLKQVLAIDLNKQQYEIMFTELISNPESLKSREYTTLAENNTEVSIKIFHYIMNNLTEKQLKKFNNKVDDFIDDLKTLEMDD
jgi:hypothetical protein